jgi:hypothetical protein
MTMLRILVAGGFNEENEELLKGEQEFAKLLGREVIGQGHTLLNACLTSFDRAVAEGAYNKVKEQGEDPNKLSFKTGSAANRMHRR